MGQVLERDKRCFYCGCHFFKGRIPFDLDLATVDHLWPSARLGANTPDNLVAACHSCNSKRGMHIPGAYKEHACCLDHARAMAGLPPDRRPKWLAARAGRLLIDPKSLKQFCESLWDDVNRITGEKIKVKADQIGRVQAARAEAVNSKMRYDSETLTQHFAELDDKLKAL